LYTVFAGGKELDDFEKWLATEYEQPGLEAIDKLVAGSRLTPSDWEAMVRLVAAQDVRTPLSFIESMRRWEQQVPDILERSIRESVKRLEEAKAKNLVLPVKSKTNEFSELIDVAIEPPATPDSDQATVRAVLPGGRRLWIASMRHLLTGAAKTLCKHRWSIAEPAGDAEWPLTDHPVLRLNYYGPGRYDFGGGWGNPGSEIMMPVSPRHLLYVQVGSKALQQTYVLTRADTSRTATTRRARSQMGVCASAGRMGGRSKTSRRGSRDAEGRGEGLGRLASGSVAVRNLICNPEITSGPA
jgi:hypothetical protein